MRIIECDQGSPEWMQARCGMITASELDNILCLDGSPRKGDAKMPHTYLCRKAAEIVRGQVEFGGGSWAMEQGHVREESAIPWFEMVRECDVRRVGFVESDIPMFGCSPDGLIREDEGLEIKSPEPTNHVKYIIAGEVPNEYWLQVQGCLLATGRKIWHFVSYHRDFAKLIVTVERDDALMAKMADSIVAFVKKLTDTVERVRELRTK